MQIINPGKDSCYITEGPKYTVFQSGVLFSLFFPTKPYEVQNTRYMRNIKHLGGCAIMSVVTWNALFTFCYGTWHRMTLNSKSYFLYDNSFNLKLSFQDNKTSCHHKIQTVFETNPCSFRVIWDVHTGVNWFQQRSRHHTKEHLSMIIDHLHPLQTHLTSSQVVLQLVSAIHTSIRPSIH